MNKFLEKIKSTFFTRKFGSFLLIGVANTGTSQLLYILFVMVHVTAGLSSILADVLSVVVSYFLNMKFTYQVKPSWKTFITFPLSYVPGWVINFLIVILCVDVLYIEEIWAKLVSVPITIPMNFVVMSLIMKLTTRQNN